MRLLEGNNISLNIKQVSDVYQMFSASSSCDEILQCAKTLQNLLEVDGVALITLVIRPDHSINIERVVSSGFGFAAKSAEWDSIYQKKKFQYIDPIVSCSKSFRNSFNWKSVPSMMSLSENQFNFLERAQEMGLKEGASIGSFSSRHIYKELNITSVCGCSLNTEQLATLELINAVSAQAMTRLMHPVEELTKREREILAWSSEGKSSWEIGMICSITERTVKFHLKNIYKKLNVQNRAQAIVCAIRQGLI
ncbi:LuxR family transcriptional regulator [Shewanella psychropiezotolerans]|uniref:LuxR family transcriptional regulator n=1 Tax=Shewanella psychropiezotolerans TaxID=2593655 RepID=A0ABX5WUZ8_9GAMM|nr:MULTISPECIES: LuxR family transcriptional regulator [Shewanella]MPY23229.1 LuxR family transcriptional regulator [Shewanella sp. YLB-07]QDO82849.1 LuxR family transcriptional regulator [Shewanella psychropiezotolerans]